jgi:hypothetical protein
MRLRAFKSGPRFGPSDDSPALHATLRSAGHGVRHCRIMHDQETVRRFIELRADGWTFSRIAAELKVSKPTLIEWSRHHQFEIQNLRVIETEALAEKLLATRQQRWKALGGDLAKVEAELAKRDLTDVPTPRLLGLAAMLRREIRRETGTARFVDDYYRLPAEQRVEEIIDWQV